jgi:hypothetical protein
MPAIGRSKSRWFQGSPVRLPDAIAADAGDDLLLLRPADRVVVVPDHLDDGVVRLRSGIGEEHAREPLRRHLDELLGEVDRRLVRLARERVVVGKLPHLLGGRLDEALLAIADGDAPQAGERLYVFLALAVEDADALAAVDDHRPALLVEPRIGIGVEGIGEVARLRRVDLELRLHSRTPCRPPPGRGSVVSRFMGLDMPVMAPAP